MKPPKTNYLILILLALLFIGVAAKADVPCQTAIEVQQATIDSLQAKLATAQSVPYNQGYQEGYKVAKGEANNIGELIGIITICLVILSVPIVAVVSALKKD